MSTSSNKILCVILGGGGHAHVVIDCLKVSGVAHPYAVLDVNRFLWGKEVYGVPIRGGDDFLPTLKQEGVTHFVPAIGGVGDNAPRRRSFEWGIGQGLIPLTLRHPSAVISSQTNIGRGTVIFAGAIINPGVVIGENCIINTGSIIDHDCTIGDHVHIAPGVTLSGVVRVGSGVHIGTGASIRQGVTIGDESIVGVGSVVVKDVSAKTIVKGVPAK